MLFVDPNGNDSTALVGRLDKPWQTVSAALLAADGLGGTEATVHVWKGDYGPENSITLNASSRITLYLEAGTRIYGIGTGPKDSWIYTQIPLDIVGAGKDNCSVRSATGGVIYADSSGEVRIKNVTISSDVTSTNVGVIHMEGRTFYIENSSIHQVNGGAINVNTINIFNGASLYVKGSTLTNAASLTWSSLSQGQASQAAWVIFERAGLNAAGRIRLHQTALSAASSSSPCNFISTDISGAGGSILIDDVYAHIGLSSAVTYTLFNDNTSSLVDQYYLGGTLVSAGDSPYPAGAWSVLTPGPASTMAYFRQSNSIAPY